MRLIWLLDYFRELRVTFDFIFSVWASGCARVRVSKLDWAEAGFLVRKL